MGASPSQIAPHYPDLQFILFDLPSTIERSRAGIERNQLLASRCKFAPGSFLENEPSKSGIPTGAQWYLVSCWSPTACSLREHVILTELLV